MSILFVELLFNEIFIERQYKNVLNYFRLTTILSRIFLFLKFNIILRG